MASNGSLDILIEIRHKSDILGMIQSNWCSGTARKFIIKGLAHQIPPDLSVRHIESSAMLWYRLSREKN